jgi:hypothetical protein
LKVEKATLTTPPGGTEKRLTEDEIALAHLGHRAVPGEPFPIENITPARKKKTPLCGLDPARTA